MASLYIIVAGRWQFVYNRCGEVHLGVCFSSWRGPSTIQKGPYSVESHLQIVKKERSKILKRESLFSEEKKPENYFFVSKSFAIFIMTFAVLFGVRNLHF